MTEDRSDQGPKWMYLYRKNIRRCHFLNENERKCQLFWRQQSTGPTFETSYDNLRTNLGKWPNLRRSYNKVAGECHKRRQSRIFLSNGRLQLPKHQLPRWICMQQGNQWTRHTVNWSHRKIVWRVDRTVWRRCDELTGNQSAHHPVTQKTGVTSWLWCFTSLWRVDRTFLPSILRTDLQPAPCGSRGLSRWVSV